jgi:hypothetical protein
MTNDDRKRSGALAGALLHPKGEPALRFFLTLEGVQDKCRLYVKFDGTHGGQITRRIDSAEDFNNFMRSKIDELRRHGVADAENAVIIQCSSTLDWPRDYTDSQPVIDLCNAIRGNRV